MPQSAPHPNCCVRSEGSSSEVAPGLNVAQPTRLSVVTGVPSARHAHKTPSAVPITIEIRLLSPDLSTRANLLQHNTPSLSDTIASENCSNAPTGTDSTHKERETSPRPPSQTLGKAVLISYTHFRLRPSCLRCLRGTCLRRDGCAALLLPCVWLAFSSREQRSLYVRTGKSLVGKNGRIALARLPPVCTLVGPFPPYRRSSSSSCPKSSLNICSLL